MDPLDIVSFVHGKTLEEHSKETTSQIKELHKKTETKNPEYNYDRALVGKAYGIKKTYIGQQMLDCKPDGEVNSQANTQGFAECVVTGNNEVSVSNTDVIENISLASQRFPKENEDDPQKRKNISPPSAVIARDVLKDLSDEPQINSEFEKKLTDGKSPEELVEETYKKENSKNESAKIMKLEFSDFNQAISESDDKSSIECVQNVEVLPQLQIEFQHVTEDIKNLEIYKKSVLDTAKCRLEDILRSLANIKQDNDLQCHVFDLLTKVEMQLKEPNEITSTKNEQANFLKKEDTLQVNPHTQVNEKETTLRNSDDINLLLIGSSGNGKSATGNSILRNNVFQTVAGTSSKSLISTKSSSKFKVLTINVIDSCGVDTNEKTKLEILKLALKSIKESLELCNYNFTALLLVIKFGSRFTQHESDTVKMIRGVLGNDVIQKYGVCVVTHGDNFEYEMEEEEEDGKVMTFEEWCHAQVGEIGEIFKECNFRCVLFNNKDKTKRESQLENLLSLIRHNEKYSRDEFLKAKEGLSKLTQELFLPEVTQKTHTFVNNIRSKIAILKFSFESNDSFLKADEMLTELHQCKNSIISAGWDESARASLLGIIDAMELEINSKLRLYRSSGDEKTRQELSLHESYFDNKPDDTVKTDICLNEKDKSYTQLEIIEHEKAITKKLRDLKESLKSLESSDNQNYIQGKIRKIKDEFRAFLSSPEGLNMSNKIVQFQMKILPTHINEYFKWDFINRIISGFNYFFPRASEIDDLFQDNF